MAKKLTDVQLVEQILNFPERLVSNREKAAEVVKKLGKRIRQRHRDRDWFAKSLKERKQIEKRVLGKKR
jgi:hypothetical protein